MRVAARSPLDRNQEGRKAEPCALPGGSRCAPRTLRIDSLASENRVLPIALDPAGPPGLVPLVVEADGHDPQGEWRFECVLAYRLRPVQEHYEWVFYVDT